MRNVVFFFLSFLISCHYDYDLAVERSSVSFLLAAINAMFLLAVLIITIEIYFDHHFNIDFTSFSSL